MKYCTNCGQRLSASTKFCTRCGAEQQVDSEVMSQPVAADSQSQPTEPASTDDVNQAQRVAPEVTAKADDSSGLKMNLIVIGFILLLFAGFFGIRGYQTYKRNHLTEQELANIGSDIADKYLGEGQVTVYYDKETNELDLVAKTGTKLYNRADDVVNGFANVSKLKPFRSAFEEISIDMSEKMPTNLRDVHVRFMNPANTNRYLYIWQDGEVTYDFTKDDD
ncbi:zinc-ribbon domain-containing protein [Lactiplantibacillus songbeiensis]|uniref:Zinc-ribbon domain-containing protein n=1 Tax=Lactiplantibacillus songbeiensis TaxID=2559920 RepID=A0ABW4C3W4_9LACO|nr:zinc ribbon domain-containing protein [Lactiplantibacillus songbeiensis]